MATEHKPQYDPRLAYAILFTDQMKKDVVFFRDVLGWKVASESEYWSEIDGGSDTLVALHAVDPKENTPALDSNYHNGNGNISIFVDDLNAFHAKMEKNNVTVIDKPEKKPWGGLFASYATPSHHRISVVEAKGTHADVLNKDAPTAADPTEARFVYFVAITKTPKDAGKWYQEHFGWKIFGQEWDEWIELEAGSSVKIPMHTEKGADDSARDHAHAAGSGALGLFVNKIDDFHNRISKLEGVKVVSEPKRQFWGGTNAGYVSPFGHYLSVTEATGYPHHHHKRDRETCEHAAENGNKKQCSPGGVTVSVKEVPKFDFVGFHDAQVAKDKMGLWFSQVLPESAAFVQENNMEVSGPPVAQYNCGPEKSHWDITAGIPVKEVTKESEKYKKHSLGGKGKYILGEYVGPYKGLEGAWKETFAKMKEMNLTMGEECWEVYMNDPESVSEDKLLTHIYIHVKG